MHPFQNTVKRILLVVHEDDARNDLTSYLSSTSLFELLPFASVEEALEGLQTGGRMDAIVAEYAMMTKESPLAQTAIRDGLPTILIAEDFDESVRALRSFALKIPVLKKPIDGEKLARLLVNYLGGQHQGGAPFMAAWWDESKDVDPRKH